MVPRFESGLLHCAPTLPPPRPREASARATPFPAAAAACPVELWPLLRRLRDDWRWTAALMLPNLVGIGFGYYYYWDVGQFDPASRFYEAPGWWPFVADSPNAVVLMSVALIGWHLGLRSRVLDSLAFLHMVYVGLWTTLLFSLYPDQLGTFDWGGTNNLLYFSHMGMPLEALVLLPHLCDRTPPPRRAALGAAVLAAWGALNLWLDYGPLSLRPAPFVRAGPELAWGSAAIMAFAVAVWAYAVGSAAKKARTAAPGSSTAANGGSSPR